MKTFEDSITRTKNILSGCFMLAVVLFLMLGAILGSQQSDQCISEYGFSFLPPEGWICMTFGEAGDHGYKETKLILFMPGNGQMTVDYLVGPSLSLDDAMKFNNREIAQTNLGLYTRNHDAPLIKKGDLWQEDINGDQIWRRIDRAGDWFFYRAFVIRKSYLLIITLACPTYNPECSETTFNQILLNAKYEER